MISETSKFLILDVYYRENTADVAGVLFQGVHQNKIIKEYHQQIDDVAPYESGNFYKRELPCLLKLLAIVDEEYDILIIDGFVVLDETGRAGLGMHLYHAINQQKPIIGVAKNSFHDANSNNKICRGNSKKPLYISSVGISIEAAMKAIQDLQGSYRLPTMLQKVDQLSRASVSKQ